MCEFESRGTRIPGAAGFVDEFVAAVVNSRIYAVDHPRVTQGIDGLLERLREYFRGPSDNYEICMADGFLVHDQRPLMGSTLTASRIIEVLEGIEGGGVAFGRRTTAKDIQALLHVFGDQRPGEGGESVDDFEIANRKLESLGGPNVRFLPPYNEDAAHDRLRESIMEAADNAAGGQIEVDVPIQLYQGAVDTLQSITIDICRQNQFGLAPVRTQIESVLKTLDQDPGSMLGVCDYDNYDAFTFGHSIRVCVLALMFSRSLIRDEETINRIGVAALMHDVGKARVPYEILQAPGRLTPEERREMELHVTHGAEILLELEDCDPWAVVSAFGHHRMAEGGGYPTTDSSIGLSASTKVVKICDVYEALTAQRPYKQGMSPVRAYRIMMSMEGHFDPEMLRLFIQNNGIYPIGTELHLSDGSLARVQAQTTDLQRPVVTVTTTPDRDKLSEEDLLTLDLSQQAPGEGIAVVGSTKEQQASVPLAS